MKTAIATGFLAILLVGATYAQTDTQASIRLKGEVQPTLVTDVKPDAAGRIKKIHVHMGEQVKAGDLLIEIDELISDEAYEKRDASLQPTGTLSKTDREIQRKEDVLSWTKVNAPCSGTVVALPVIEGQVVAPSTNGKSATTLLTIGDLSKLIVQGHVPQVDASKVAVKQAVQVTSDSAPGEQVEGTISFVAPIATTKNSIKGFEVQALIEKPSPWLRPGMTVRLNIPVTAHK